MHKICYTKQVNETKEITFDSNKINSKCIMYLQFDYSQEKDNYTIFVTPQEEKATIFDVIECKYNDHLNNSRHVVIKYGDHYLNYDNCNNKLVLGLTSTVFTINNKNNIIFTLNDIEYILSSSMEFININIFESHSNFFDPVVLQKFNFKENIEEINIVVFDCMGNDEAEIKYLKSITNNKFIDITILKTMNHIFHSRKHVWSMYFGFSALNNSSTVEDLKYQIDYYLSKGHIVNLCGHGYGGAIVIKAIQTPQNKKSIEHFGHMTSHHLKNLYVSTFGSYILTHDPNVKQYMIIGDTNIQYYTRLVQPSPENPHFKNNILIDHLQNIIWLRDNGTNLMNNENKVAKYLDIISTIIND